MKFIYTLFSLICAAVMAGCTTASQVQEMIDASHKEYRGQLSEHEESISVLKKSSVVSLEKSAEHAERLGELERKAEALAQQIAIIKDLANASKVISAENTVKISNLEEQVIANKEEADKLFARMNEIDRLYEEVLIRQYQAIADSANAAIASLKEDGFSASTNAPVELDDPIEIVAPDTAVPTNVSEPVMQSVPVTDQ